MKNLQYKSVDLMKFTKDLVTNQFDDATIRKIITNVVTTIHPTHIAISVPLNSTDEYPTTTTPKPKTVGDFMQTWTDTIHAAGINVLFRGTFCEIEGIYNFPRKVGSNKVAPQVYFDKITALITGRPELFKSGDIWAPLPERTEGIFSDATSFIDFGGPGVQTNYVDFFNKLIDISIIAFQKQNISGIKTGMTANNFSEVNSGWIPQSLFDKAGILVVDHYGSDDTDGAIGHGRTPANMDRDLRAIANQHGKKVFLQEWANISTGAITDTKAMFDEFTKLATEGLLIGFNYWEPGAGQKGSLLNNDFSINETGQLLGQYFGTPVPPTPTPVPVPTPVPTQEKEVTLHLGTTETFKKLVGRWKLGIMSINTKCSGTITLQDTVDGTLATFKASYPEGVIQPGFLFKNGVQVLKTSTGDITLVLIAT